MKKISFLLVFILVVSMVSVTVNYRTQGNHIVENSYTGQRYEFISISQIASYVN